MNYIRTLVQLSVLQVSALIGIEQEELLDSSPSHLYLLYHDVAHLDEVVQANTCLCAGNLAGQIQQILLDSIFGCSSVLDVLGINRECSNRKTQ
jgi:hypothetical protein